MNKGEIPRAEHPTRLERRQRPRTMKYMLQIDSEAYCGAVPIPGTLRNTFVFRARNGAHFRPCAHCQVERDGVLLSAKG